MNNIVNTREQELFENLDDDEENSQLITLSSLALSFLSQIIKDQIVVFVT